jgi:hypothetical protein
MENDPTPINARPQRRQPEAVEDLSLALREHLLWPVDDRLLGLSDRARAAVAGGVVVLALGLGIGALSLLGSGSPEPAGTSPVAVVSERTPHAAPVTPAPEAKPEPTLHGAAPVFKPIEGQQKVGESTGVESGAGEGGAAAATGANTGNPATDTIASSPSARAAGATTSSTQTADLPDGPPAGPAAIAVARKFADNFVVYETGGAEAEIREAFKATATPELTKALMRRPPHQPAGIEVPQAKVLNIVPAPSHGTIYPLSVSLLRVGVTSELRLEMEQLKNQGWRVTNVLG